jgi:hypothetical protein
VQQDPWDTKAFVCSGTKKRKKKEKNRLFPETLYRPSSLNITPEILGPWRLGKFQVYRPRRRDEPFYSLRLVKLPNCGNVVSVEVNKFCVLAYT